MKRTDGFLLKYIEGVPYLLPYGQRIVEHRRNLRLNETSAYLWEILPECASPHELHEKMTTHWEAETAEERDRLWQDLQGILAQFQAFGLIEPFREESELPNSVSYYNIADIRIRIQGAPDSLSAFFAPYAAADSTSSELDIRIHPSAPLSTAPLGGELLGCDPELLMMLEHMVLSHHGVPEYGSPKPPMFPEAEALHILDLLDARMFEMNRALQTVQPGCFTDRIWSLERKLYRRKDVTEN